MVLLNVKVMRSDGSGIFCLGGGLTEGNFLFAWTKGEFFVWMGYIAVTRYESHVIVMQCRRFSINITHECHFKKLCY